MKASNQRRKLLSRFLILAVFLANLGSAFSGLYETAMAATYHFSQTTWTGGASTSTFPTHASNTANSYSGTWWNKYYSKTASTTAGATIVLASSSGSVVQTDDSTSTTGFNMPSSTTSGTSITGSGSNTSIILRLSSALYTDAVTSTGSFGNSANGVAFHPGGNYFAVAHNGAPYLSVYSFNPADGSIGNGFTTSSDFGNPGNAVAFSPNGRFLAVGVNSPATGQQRLSVFNFTPGAFNAISGIIGSKLANPAFPIPGSITNLTFSPDGKYIVVTHQASPYVTVYNFDQTNGTIGNAFFPISGQEPDGVANAAAFSPNEDFLAVAHNGNPFYSIYPFTASTYNVTSGILGTRSPRDTSSNGLVNTGEGVSFNPAGDFLAFAESGGTKYMSVYPFSPSTSTYGTDHIGTKLSTSTYPGSVSNDIAFSPDGAYLADTYGGNDGQFRIIYSFNAPSGSLALGTNVADYGSAAALPSDGYAVAFHPSSTYVVFAHNITPNDTYNFTVYSRVPRYPTTGGVYTSGVIDFGSKQNFTTMQYASSGLSGTTTTIDIRVGNDAFPPDSWTSSTANWSTSTGVISNIASSGASIASLSGYRYLRYRATLLTNNPFNTPSLNSVTFNRWSYATSSTLQGPAFDAEASSSIVSGFKWTDNVSATSGTDVLFQLRSGLTTSSLLSATFIGPDSTANSYFSSSTCSKSSGLVSCTIPSTSTLRNGSDDRLFQYQGTLLSDGYNTPTITGVTSTYIVNASPVVTSVTATSTTSVSSPTSTVRFQFQVQDTDTATGTVSSSFQYSTSSNPSWGSVASIPLAYLNSTSTDRFSALPSSTPFSRTVSWDPKSQLPETYATSVQVRVVSNDFELANNLGSATGTLAVLDTKTPTAVSLSFDSRSDALTVSGSDDSNLQYILSNSSTLGADSQNGSSGVWISANTASLSTTTTWNATGTPSAETIYAQVRDIYGNTTSTNVVAPQGPQSLATADISNIYASIFSEYLSWTTSTSVTGATTDFYEVYRSSNNTSSFSRIATTTSGNYLDSGLTSSTLYYYKVATKSTQGNYSNYSNIVSDQPNGRGVNAAPVFDTAFDSTNGTGILISQIATTTDSNWGKMLVQYRFKDTDSSFAPIPYAASTTLFEYNTGNGWQTIPTSTLNSTSTGQKSISSSTFTTFTALWNVSTTLPSTTNSNLQVRVTVDDGEVSNNTTQAVSAPVSIDTVKPTLSSSLLVNGYTTNAPATSTSVTLGLQNITGTPAGETIYPQFSNDGTTWYGMSGGATTTGLGTAVSSTAGALSALSFPWVVSGSNTVYLRVVDAFGNYSTTSSVAVQGINQAPQIQNLSVSQAATTTTSGLVNISYELKDADTTSSVPSFAYSTNGVSWTTLSGMNSTSTATKTVVSSSFTSFSATWNATSQLPSTRLSDLQLRLTVSDGQTVNSTTVATTSFALDTQAPTASASIDARSGRVSFSLSDANNLQYVLSNDSDLSSDGVNSSSGIWQTVGSSSFSASTTWILGVSSTFQKVYLGSRDVYGNATQTVVVAPPAPTGVTLQDISNSNTGDYKFLVTWSASLSTTSASVAYYEIYRSTGSSSFATVGSSTNTFFNDVGLTFNTNYSYKVAAVATNGNYSDYSNTESAAPVGSSGGVAPSFDESLDPVSHSGVLISQVATTTDTDWGKLNILYSIKGAYEGSVNPSYEYNIGSGWVALSVGALNSTSTDSKSVVTSSYTVYRAVWTVADQLPDVYLSNLQVRVIIADASSSDSIAQAVSAPITLDTTAPTLSSSLLVNGYTTNAPATSTSVTLGLQNITGTPTGETIYPQFSNDGLTWYGMSGGATTTGLGTAVSSTAGALSALSFPWTVSGSNTVYVKIIDSRNNRSSVGSVDIQGINHAPQIESFSAYQATSSDPRDGGMVVLSYTLSDLDSNSVTPSFAYNRGAGWVTVPTSTLNTTSTQSKSATPSSTTYIATWSATSTVTSTYTTDLQVRLTVDDGQNVHSSDSATTTITLDSKAPTGGAGILLIDGASSSVQTVTSTITLSLEGVTGNPAGETIYAQFSDDNSTWYGANADGTLASSSSWGSGFSSASTSLSWFLSLSGRSRTIYFRATDAYGNGLLTDTNSVGYNTPPNFNPLYGTNGLSVSQVSSSVDSSWGKVSILYNVRDTDTASGSSTRGYVTPSFEYTIGAGWSSITTSSLAVDDLSNKAVDGSSYTTYAATWNASSQIPSAHTTALQIRVTVNDNEPVSHTAVATSSLITLDTKAPSTTVQIDSRVDRVVVSSADDSLIEYNLSNASSLVADGSNASSGTWVSVGATSTNVSSSWIFVADASSTETVYYSARDAFGNTRTGSASVPPAPASTTISDISNASSSRFKELVSWTAYTATSGPTFSDYEVYRATDADPSTFSLLASVSDSAQNYYTDTSVTSSTTYYYKVAIRTTNGDYSNYGETVSDQPDGLSGSSAQGPTISDLATPEIRASWARITWTTDRVADSKVEYSIATSGAPYALSTSSLTLVGSHDITINDLLPNTTYSFRVVSKDVNNKESALAGSDFTTTGGPIISAVTTESVTDHTASIIWNTNKDSDSVVVYGTNLQNLREGVSTSEAGSTSLVGSPFQHRVALSGLNTQTIYYYYVKSTDVSANLSTDKNNGNFYSFSTAQDTKAPVISNILLAAATQNAAIITWQTDEPANSQILYDSRSASSSGQAYRNLTTLDDTLTVGHSMVISGLTKSSTYYYAVKSIDAAGNSATSDEASFQTNDSETPIVNYVSSGGGASAPVDVKDKTAPGISNIEVSEITPFSAKITFKTNEDAIGFASLGETAEYGRTVGEPQFRTDHMIPLTNLKLGTTYHLGIKASDKSGNFATSPDQTFTTKFAVESAGDIAKLDSVEQYQTQIDQLIESITPSLITPFVGKVEVSDVAEDSAVVKWTTNTKTYGSVLYVADKDYDEKKDNPYLAEVSDTQTKTTTHQVKLSSLAYGQLYRFKIKAYTLPNVTGFSQEKTFTTKSSKIRPDVVKLLNTSFVVTWQTPKKTTSFVEYQNAKTGQIKQSGNDTPAASHVVNVENLEPNATYKVRAFGYDDKNNIVESETITVTTKRDITAPVISGLKIDNTFVPGRNDRIQTVISWKTDEPASSLILYGEGATAVGKGLSDTASSTDTSLNTTHNVIITNFKPGTIYQMQVVSVDSAGNKATSPLRVIITPKQSQSVFDVIVKNFEGTFKFVNPQ